MTATAIGVLETLRLPTLFRKACLYAGMPVAPGQSAEGRFVLRSGKEPPDLFATILRDAFADGETEILVCRGEHDPGLRELTAGRVVVRDGFDGPCPEELLPRLREAARCGPGGLVFAIERRDGQGRLRGVTWAAVPEEEPAPEAPFRAAVARESVRPSALVG